MACLAIIISFSNSATKYYTLVYYTEMKGFKPTNKYVLTNGTSSITLESESHMQAVNTLAQDGYIVDEWLFITNENITTICVLKK